MRHMHNMRHISFHPITEMPQRSYAKSLQLTQLIDFKNLRFSIYRAGAKAIEAWMA